MDRLRTLGVAAEQATRSLREYCWLAWLLFGTGYLALVALLSADKGLWYDEIVTLYICKLPSMGQVIEALKDGADANPPVFHVITRASLSVFGESPFALRLPAVLGFAAMCWGIFRFTARRVSDCSAWSAVIAVFLTTALYYATEARPYGLVLGFSALALVCWQSAVEGRGRRASIAGMGLCCAAALSCHYFGVLIVAPLFVGELVRWLTNRKVDVTMAGALIASLIPLALYVPLIMGASNYAENVNAAPAIGNILLVYDALMAHGSLLFVGLAGVAMVGLAVFGTGSDSAEPLRSPPSVPSHEVAVVLMLLLTPVTALCCSYLTGGFIDRYAIITTLGFGLLFAFAVEHVAWRHALIGVLSLLLVLGSLFAKEHFALIRSVRGIHSFRVPPVVLRAAEEGVVVIENPAACLDIVHHAPPDVRKQLYCIVDTGRARRLSGNPSPGTGLLRLRKWAPLPVAGYDAFLRDHTEFLVYRTDLGREFAWLLAELSRDERVAVKLVARSPGEALFHVTRR